MKRLKICFVIFIASYHLLSCDDRPYIRKHIEYPDMISPIYYIDTFQIISPRVAIVDSVPYIFSLEKIEPFENKEDFLDHKNVIRYFTPDLHFFRSIYYLTIYGRKNWEKTFRYMLVQNEFYFEEMFLSDDSINNIPVYKFVFEPETFLLTLISPIDSLIRQEGHDDVILDIIFTKDYFLALAPIYSERDLKKINELWYYHLWGEDLDLSKYKR